MKVWHWHRSGSFYLLERYCNRSAPMDSTHRGTGLRKLHSNQWNCYEKTRGLLSETGCQRIKWRRKKMILLPSILIAPESSILKNKRCTFSSHRIRALLTECSSPVTYHGRTDGSDQGHNSFITRLVKLNQRQNPRLWFSQPYGGTTGLPWRILAHTWRAETRSAMKMSTF